MCHPRAKARGDGETNATIPTSLGLCRDRGKTQEALLRMGGSLPQFRVSPHHPTTPPRKLSPARTTTHTPPKPQCNTPAASKVINHSFLY